MEPITRHTGIDRLIIRVYGLFILDGKMLITDERYSNHEFTKFPGGGLELGEGLKDCLEREWLEETGVEIQVNEHFYTSDFFQRSAFAPNHQIVCVYFMVAPKGDFSIKVSDKPYNFDYKMDKEEVFRWVDVEKVSPDDFSWPVDKHVASLLMAKYQKLC